MCSLDHAVVQPSSQTQRIWVSLQAATLLPSSSSMQKTSSSAGAGQPRSSGNASHLLQQPSHAQAAEAGSFLPSADAIQTRSRRLSTLPSLRAAPVSRGCCGAAAANPNCSAVQQHGRVSPQSCEKGWHRGCPSTAKPPELAAGPAAMSKQPTATGSSTSSGHPSTRFQWHCTMATRQPGSLPQLRAATPCFHHSSLLPRKGFWRLISCLSSFLWSLWPPSRCCSVLESM